MKPLPSLTDTQSLANGTQDEDATTEATDTSTEEDGDRIVLSDETKEQIVFVSQRDGNEEIYVMDADGSNQHRLTNNDASDPRSPSWSPDGKRVCFQFKPR